MCYLLEWQEGPMPRKTTRSGKGTDTFNMDELAAFIGVDTAEDLYEHNVDYIGEAGFAARKEALEEGATEEDAEEAEMKGQQAAQDEIYHSYRRALESTVETLLEKHNLQLQSYGKYAQYKILPADGKTWTDAAAEIMSTIHGVGSFEFASLKEFKDSGPYASYKEAVLKHLGWIKRWPDVYGGTSIQRMFDDAWR